MIIHEICDDTNSDVIKLLSDGLRNDTSDVNYSPLHSRNSANLFYILANGRYTTGKYYVIEEDGKYIASAGWNKYDDNTAIILSRAYILKSRRANYTFAKTCLPLMLKETAEIEKVWITCNKHNKAIYDWFCLADAGKRPALFNNWPDIYKEFKPIGMKNIYHTDQYVVQHRK